MASRGRIFAGWSGAAPFHPIPASPACPDLEVGGLDQRQQISDAAWGALIFLKAAAKAGSARCLLNPQRLELPTEGRLRACGTRVFNHEAERPHPGLPALLPLSAHLGFAASLSLSGSSRGTPLANLLPRGQPGFSVTVILGQDV